MKKIQIIKILDSAVRRFIILALSIYQHTISPDHSAIGRTMRPFGYCRFYPSCSDYAKRVFKETNTLSALLLTLSRVIRCNPWSKGGIDYPFLRKHIG